MGATLPRVMLVVGGALGLLLAVAVGPAVRAAAQPAPPTPTSFDSSLTVRPSRVVVPADRIARPQTFTLINRGRSAVDVIVRTTSFTEDRAGRLRLGDVGTLSAATWTTVTPDRLRLAAGTVGRVRLRIAAPASAGAGEHHVAVLFSVPATRSRGRIAVAHAIGVPVYVTVPGPAVDSIRVDRLDVEPTFSLRGPITFTATLRNTGNLHRDFLDKHRIGVQVGEHTVPFAGFTLVRGASRDLRTRWAEPPLMCVCRASLTVTSHSGTARTATATVVILPLQLLVPATALMLALLLTVVLGWRRRRRARRRLAADPVGVGVGGPVGVDRA
ncbi:MAG TPA: hypothetical protein VE287_01515 [Actinopolymorphaceae bacterium]|nr:hypothetical protein [Actinopolymorphaceae bacterium]